MTWNVVARKEFEDTIRSRWLIALSVLFALLIGAAVYVTSLIFGGSGATLSSTRVLRAFPIKDGIVTTLLPLVALVVSYNAVVGERETGSLKLLLALPHARSDVVVGKVAGRAAALAVALVAGFALPGLVFLLSGTFTLEAVAYVQYVFFVVLLAAAFVSVGVGVSAAVDSNRLAIAAAVAIYLVFVALLGAVQGSLGLFSAFVGWPEWIPLTVQQTTRVLQLLNPAGAFKFVINGTLGSGLFLETNSSSGVGPRLQLSGLLMLLAWVVVPPLLGLIRFEETDL
ncbi:MAG: ABC transporter permease subunit [Haloferacaceae archaeon]